MSEYEADHVYLRGYTRFKFLGHDIPVTLPADGVLVIDEESAQGAMVRIKDGEVLKGIRVVPNGGGDMVDEWDDDDAAMLILMAEDGGTVTVIDEDVGVTEPMERISVSDGADTAINNMHVQVFNQYTPSASGRRWRVNDWMNV